MKRIVIILLISFVISSCSFGLATPTAQPTVEATPTMTATPTATPIPYGFSVVWMASIEENVVFSKTFSPEIGEGIDSYQGYNPYLNQSIEFFSSGEPIGNSIHILIYKVCDTGLEICGKIYSVSDSGDEVENRFKFRASVEELFSLDSNTEFRTVFTQIYYPQGCRIWNWDYGEFQVVGLSCPKDSGNYQIA